MVNSATVRQYENEFRRDLGETKSAVCCCMVQCVAVCCSVLQFGEVWCSEFQCVAMCSGESAIRLEDEVLFQKRPTYTEKETYVHGKRPVRMKRETTDVSVRKKTYTQKTLDCL